VVGETFSEIYHEIDVENSPHRSGKNVYWRRDCL